MSWIAILFALAASVATWLGGQFALRFKDRMHLILSFSAGALLGVVFFDLLPEAIESASSGSAIGSAMAAKICALTGLGFIIYLFLDKGVTLHPHSEDQHCENPHHGSSLSVGSLAFHSLLDGVAMGLAFKAGNAIGFVVAVAILTHDFSDGINTIGLVLAEKGSLAQARKWLLVDALAPVLGVCLTFFVSVTPVQLAMALSVFAGFFLYIGAVDLLPEVHHEHPGFWTVIITSFGMGLIYLVVQMAHAI